MAQAVECDSSPLEGQGFKPVCETCLNYISSLSKKFYKFISAQRRLTKQDLFQGFRRTSGEWTIFGQSLYLGFSSCGVLLHHLFGFTFLCRKFESSSFVLHRFPVSEVGILHRVLFEQMLRNAPFSTTQVLKNAIESIRDKWKRIFCYPSGVERV